MAYIGKSIESGTFKVLDTSGNTYNGSNVTFSLGTQVGSAAQLLVSHDGVIQKPGTDYTLASGGASITFSTAPASGASIFIVEISGAVGGTITPADNSVGVTQLNLSDGSSGQFIKTDGSGTLSFASVASLAGIDDQSSSNDDQLTITDTAVVINEDSDDVDFRVESNGNANMLFVSGGNDVVGVGAEGDLGVGLHIKTADTSGSVSGDADELVIEGTGHNGMTILSGTSHEGRINFGDSGGSNRGFFSYDHSADAAFVGTGGNNIRMKVAADGDVLIAKTSVNSATVGHQLHAVGEVAHTRQAQNVAIFNREDNGSGQNFDGQLISFRADNTEQGTINISSSTTSYNAFSGAHWGRLSDNSAPTILRGTVIESIATMIDWYRIKMTNSDGYEFHEEIALPNGKSVGDTISHTAEDGVTYNGVIEKQINEQLPMTKISDTEDSKAVYGVFNSWDNEPDDGINDMLVTALGAFIVRIHKDETVAIGDLLSSKGDGTAKKQTDDIFRASTIAKVTSTEKTYTYDDGSYCVPCTLHCG